MSDPTLGAYALAQRPHDNRVSGALQVVEDHLDPDKVGRPIGALYAVLKVASDCAD